MATLQETRRKFKGRFRQKQDRARPLPAVLGDGYGNLFDTDTGQNFVYARVAGKIATVFNTRVQPHEGLKVWVGYDANEPALYQVLSTRSNSTGVTFSGGGTAPASYYAWGGTDAIYVQLRQFMPFRPWVTNSDMILHVYRGFVMTATGPKFVDIQTTDLTSYIPTTVDTAALVLITIDTSGALVVTDGADVTPLTDLVTTTTMTNLPAIPAATAYIIAAVRVFKDANNVNQTIIFEPTAVSGSNEDIRNDLVDLRFMNGPSLGIAGGDLSGFYPNPSVIQASGAFALTGDISPAQITSDQDNYNPTGLSSANTLRISTDASRDITGLAGGADGRLIALTNVGSFNIVLKDESGSSTAANRFALYADKTIAPDTGVILQYDNTSLRWRIADAMFYGDVAGGDLGGIYPNPDVMKLRGFSVGNTAPSDGDVLTWDDGIEEWVPAAPTGGGGSGGGLILNVDTTAVGNVGSGEDTLITYTVPGDTLLSDEMFIHFTASGQFAATANNKRVKAHFGGTVIFDTGVLAITTAGDWTMEGWIVRTGAATQKAHVEFHSSQTATLAASAQYSTPGETLSGTVVLKCTGEATTNDDIIQRVLVVDVNGGTTAVATVVDGPQGFLINGYIDVTVASNNLTVAIKTLAGTDPSSSDPVYVRIGNTRRAITGALSVTKNAGTNWCNSGGGLLAAQEVDYFVYLGYNATDGVVIGFSRIPYAQQYDDFSTTTTNDRYAAISTITTAAATDHYELIGRFAATLSAGAGYTWTVPTFTPTNLISHPIFESRWLSGNYTLAAGTVFSSGGTITSLTSASGTYQVLGRNLKYDLAVDINNNGTGSGVLHMTLPFSYVNQGISNWGGSRENSAGALRMTYAQNGTNSLGILTTASAYPGTNPHFATGEVRLI